MKYGRNDKNTSQLEFADELRQVNCIGISNDKLGIQTATQNVYKTIENILSEISPIKKLTKTDIGLGKIPWITKGS